MALVLEDEVVDVPSEPAQLLDDVARLALDHPWVVLALDDEQRAGDVGDVGLRRALDQEVAVLLGVADREREVGLPRLGSRSMNVNRSYGPNMSTAPRHSSGCRAASVSVM